MSKISTYPIDTTVTLSDKVIGSDAENSNSTKNYTLGDIAKLFYSSTYFGSFYDTTDQTVSSGGIAAFKYNTTDISNGVSITNNLSSQPTRITVANSGVYNIQFSAQLQRLSGGSSKKVTIWLRVNGTDVPNTATNLTVQANATYLLASWNFYQLLTANQYAEIMWTQDDAIDIVHENADLSIPHPAVPSIILTVNKVG
jgi:hypothetical protein